MDIFEGVELPEEAKEALQAKVQAAIESKQKEWEESTSGLKTKVDELLGEKKKEAQKRREAEEAAKREAEEKAKSENDFKQLYESSESERTALAHKLQELEQGITREKVNGEAARIAASLTKDTGKAELLKKEISSRLSLTDDGLKVLDESGNLTVSTLEDLTAQVKERYAFLVDGSPASGGGATGARGSAEAKAKEITRSEFNKLDQTQRHEFVKKGGKVISE